MSAEKDNNTTKKFNPEYGEKFHQRLLDTYQLYINFNQKENENLVYCKTAVLQTYKEIFHDMDFMSIRRLKKGIGRCKLAGVILWRLYKSHFVRFQNETACNRDNSKLNPVFEISLLYVLLHVLRINPENTREKYTQVLRELEYQIIYRHINQESIALVFKTICQSEKLLNIETQTLNYLIKENNITEDKILEIRKHIQKDLKNCCEK